MSKIRQKFLDFMYRLKAKFGVQLPNRDLYFSGLIGADVFRSYGPRVHKKEIFQWFPRVIWNGYSTKLKARYAPHDGRPFACDRVESIHNQSWVGKTLRFRFTSDVGKYGWNAIWLYGVNEDGVNHEIDLIEHYGNSGDPKSETNLHWGDYEDNHNHARAVQISCGDKQRLEGTVSLDWSDPDEILILFNGTVVRKIVQKDIIATFKTSRMSIIMNAGMKYGAEQDSVAEITVHSILE